MLLWFQPFDWPLFTSALISSTLFPGGSEALLLYRLNEGVTPPYALILIATLGNVLGSCITYGMGRFGINFAQKWLRISTKKTAYAEQHFKRYGHIALLFSWLPIIGDPLCLIAGALRYHIIIFIVLVGLGKLARYSLLAWAFV